MYRFTFSFLTLALVRGDCSASLSGLFTPGDRVPGTHYLGWVGPRAGLDDTQKGRFLTLLGLEL
jgi:hypothetical protein